MRVFDLVGDANGQRAGTSIAVIGSCRVHEPFETLANNGRAVRVWANASSATHTFGPVDHTSSLAPYRSSHISTLMPESSPCRCGG